MSRFLPNEKFLAKGRAMEGSRKILVVDDGDVRSACQHILSQLGAEVLACTSNAEALSVLAEGDVDLVIVGLDGQESAGLDLLRALTVGHPLLPSLAIVPDASLRLAVEAVRLGARDVFSRPFTSESLCQFVQKVLSQSDLDAPCFRRDGLDRAGSPVRIIGESQVIRDIEAVVERVGPTDATVLIFGESGTGKELVARSVHQHSLRRSGPFIPVDCGGLAKGLFESELFGHVRGSFTGAVAAKQGLFQLANAGSIFFDEVGNIDRETQAKLLRATQEREIRPVGASQVTKIDVRIIAATNSDLYQAMKEGIFREDLFYRLSVVPIYLPPLRQRTEDIPLLVDYFLAKHGHKAKHRVEGVQPDVLDSLCQYEWPGNVRELENTIHRAVVMADGPTVSSKDVAPYSLTRSTPVTRRPEPETGHTLAEMEKEYISHVLRQTNGVKTTAAKILGITRKTLWRKIKDYGIE